ncbi:MAG: rod shape-determining protein MreC [Bacteroidales bacterium]
MKTVLDILRHNLYLLIFFILEFFSLLLFFRYNHYQSTQFYTLCTEINGYMQNIGEDYRHYWMIKDDNAALQEENAQLRAQIATSYFSAVHPINSSLYDTVFQQMYTYIPSTVLSNSVDLRNNHLILDAGKDAGVAPGMAVISPNGIVGIVERVSEHFCSVISVLHSQSRVSVRLASSIYSGSLHWDGLNYNEALLTDIPSHVQVKEGETVITSGFSLAYPAGITVGFVKEILPINGEDFYTLKITFSEDYKRLHKVYIVKNLYKREIDALEEGHALTEE